MRAKTYKKTFKLDDYDDRKAFEEYFMSLKPTKDERILFSQVLETASDLEVKVKKA